MARRATYLLIVVIAWMSIATVASGSDNTACAKDGDCPSCKPGECKVWVEQKVGPGDYVYTGDPACAQDMNSQAKQLVRALADSQIPGISIWAGPLIDSATGQLQTFIKDNVRGTIGNILSPYTDPRANCQIVALVVPYSSEVTGYEVWARDAHANEKCTVGQDCAGGWCKWTQPPVTVEQGDTKLIYSTFKNWSDDRERGAKLIIYFKPGKDWIQPR
jgi:hypothetical protein